MAGIQLDASITLVVKTPNRTVDDFQVKCALDWTVAKLKKHLSDVYPSKPASKQQRLIYSGQLLLDHQTFKEFLREPIEENFHTLHLVCPPGPSTSAPATPSSSVTQLSSSSPSRSNEAASPTPSTTCAQPDGVRHRGSNIQTPPPFQMPYQQMWNMQSPVQGQSPPPYPGGYRINQQQWMQHMQQMHMYHQQQMAAGRLPSPPFMFMPPNMAMGQMPFWPHSANIGVVPTTPAPTAAPPMSPQPPQQAQPAAQAAAPPQQVNEEVRMNAQGGIANDDDEENLNNDWLDKIYTLCRVAILLSIVWFYSTTGRFLTLIVLLFLVYMYQWGVFQWIMRHRNGQANNQQQPQAAPPAQQQQPEAENRNQDNVDGGEREGEETLEGEEPPPPPPPPGPSVFTIAVNFVSTFFTSLIPQNHDPIPGN